MNIGNRMERIGFLKNILLILSSSSLIGFIPFPLKPIF